MNKLFMIIVLLTIITVGILSIISYNYTGAETCPCCNNQFPPPPPEGSPNKIAHINYDGNEEDVTYNEWALFWSAYLSYGDTDPAEWLCPALPSPIEGLPLVPIPQDFNVFVTEDDHPEIVWTHYYVHEYRIERKIGSGAWTNIAIITTNVTESYIDYGIIIPDPKGRTVYYRMRGKVYDTYSDYTDEKIPIANEERLLPKKLADNNLHSGPLPDEFALLANYPNPFNSATVIRFQLPYETHVTLRIYNIQGEDIRILVNDNLLSGTQQVEWDGTDYLGRKVASVIYFYQLMAGEFKQTQKMTLAY